MRGKLQWLLLVLSCSALLPRGAAAQHIASPYRFLGAKQGGTFFAGYLLTGRGSLQLGPRSGPIFGARYDIILSGPFAIEADLGYFSRTRAVWDTTANDTTRHTVGDANFRAVLATAALRFNLTGPRTYHGILPYLLFGLGAALDVSGSSPAETDLGSDIQFNFGTSFTGVLGGGSEFAVGDHLALRVDARNLLWKLKTPRAFLLKSDQALLLPADEWAQNLSLTAGLVIRF